mgnify:CR=1 FL=1
MLEAIYCDCAIIATPNEGANEIINDNINGLLIEKSDPKKIKERILELLNNHQIMEKISKIGKQKIKETFNWDKSAKIYLHNFNQAPR